MTDEEGITTELDQNWIWIPNWVDCDVPTVGPTRPADAPSAGRIVHFRRTFHLPDTSPSSLVDLVHPDQTAVIHLSADTRYKLFLNGQRVTLGPARGTSPGGSGGSSSKWYYDSVDLASTPNHLKWGQENVLDVWVVRFFPNAYTFTGGNNGAAAVPFPRGRFPGLTVWGEVLGENVSTGKGDGEGQWRCRLDKETRFVMDSEWDIFLNVFEDVEPSDGQRDEEWVKPMTYGFIPLPGALLPWNLSARGFPQPGESPCPFKTIRHSSSHIPPNQWDDFLHGRSGASISLTPGSSHRLELEFECHSTAYVKLVAKRPEVGGSKVKLTYSEAYERLPRPRKAAPQKGDRTQREGQGLVGPSDSYAFKGLQTPAADNHRDGRDSGLKLQQVERMSVRSTEREDQLEVYEPFFWKTFRFIVLEIEVSSSGPLQLRALEFTQTNYPMGVRAKFETGDETMQKMWEVSLRTMRNCMFDGYYDCPFYEQLVYGEDSRSAMLFHYLLSGDDRLARHSINSFATSLQPDGLLCGSFPSTATQILPGFSLFWILAVCDHMLYFDDPGFVRRHLPIIDAIFGFFERYIDPETGLVGRFPGRYWHYIDWNRHWPGGYPDVGEEDPLSFFTMIYGYTLRRAAKLLAWVGRPSLREEYLSRAEKASKAIMTYCYDGQFFTDTVVHPDPKPSPSAPTKASPYSQVAQIWGILCATAAHEHEHEHEQGLTSRDAERIITTAYSSPNFSFPSYPMRHYGFRALSQFGGPESYDKFYSSNWEPWRKMLDKNLTTWEEDDVNSRSDCHQWSSLPIYEFLAEVAGLTPLEPGWKAVRFAPRVRLHERLSARVVMGEKGVAEVKWRPRQAEDGGAADSLLTDPVTGNGEGWQGKRTILVTLKLPEPIRVIHRRRDGQHVDRGIIQDLTYYET